MVKEKLNDYPILTDPLLIFEATRQNYGRGSCNLDIRETQLSSGKVVVYMISQREGDEVVETSLGCMRKCELGIVVCGYLIKRWFGLSKKVKVIPETERVVVESELVGRLKHKPAFVEFLGTAE
ncbi:MAG: hypothetical protein QXF25_03215 [Candidatus Pacearchaeota archaeon]